MGGRPAAEQVAAAAAADSAARLRRRTCVAQLERLHGVGQLLWQAAALWAQVALGPVVVARVHAAVHHEHHAAGGVGNLQGRAGRGEGGAGSAQWRAGRGAACKLVPLAPAVPTRLPHLPVVVVAPLVGRHGLQVVPADLTHRACEAGRGGQEESLQRAEWHAQPAGGAAHSRTHMPEHTKLLQRTGVHRAMGDDGNGEQQGQPRQEEGLQHTGIGRVVSRAVAAAGGSCRGGMRRRQLAAALPPSCTAGCSCKMLHSCRDPPGCASPSWPASRLVVGTPIFRCRAGVRASVPLSDSRTAADHRTAVGPAGCERLLVVALPRCSPLALSQHPTLPEPVTHVGSVDQRKACVKGSFMTHVPKPPPRQRPSRTSAAGALKASPQFPFMPVTTHCVTLIHEGWNPHLEEYRVLNKLRTGVSCEVHRGARRGCRALKKTRQEL